MPMVPASAPPTHSQRDWRPVCRSRSASPTRLIPTGMMFCGKPNLYLSRFHLDQENATGNRSSVRDASANSNRRFSVNFAPLVTGCDLLGFVGLVFGCHVKFSIGNMRSLHADTFPRTFPELISPDYSRLDALFHL